MNKYFIFFFVARKSLKKKSTWRKPSVKAFVVITVKHNRVCEITQAPFVATCILPRKYTLFFFLFGKTHLSGLSFRISLKLPVLAKVSVNRCSWYTLAKWTFALKVSWLCDAYVPQRARFISHFKSCREVWDEFPRKQVFLDQNGWFCSTDLH